MSAECGVRNAEYKDGIERSEPVIVTPHSAFRTPHLPRRVVLLGASNLTRGMSTAFETAATYWGRPLEIFAALGHGRSYGMLSSLLGRRLPGILSCGLWQALEARPPAPTAALLTDIGNDLLYEVPPVKIADWLRECTDRLLAMQARVIMTMLPLSNSTGLSEWRFTFLRTCFFPSCHLGLAELMSRAAELDELLRDICAEREIPMIEQRQEWYGFDPIHIRLRNWRTAWGEILSPWCDGTPPQVPWPSRRSWLRLRLLAPQQRWFFGLSQRRVQPAGGLNDGSTVFLY